VYMDITVGLKDAGRLVFELYADTVPLTVKNFISLCRGDVAQGQRYKKRLHYLNSVFHRVIKGFMCQVCIPLPGTLDFHFTCDTKPLSLFLCSLFRVVTLNIMMVRVVSLFTDPPSKTRASSTNTQVVVSWRWPTAAPTQTPHNSISFSRVLPT